MYIDDSIREAIRTAFGRNKQLGSDKEYQILREDIMEETGGEELDVNTLKRVMDHWGKEKSGEADYKFSVKTLNIIARYLGYTDWNDLKCRFGTAQYSSMQRYPIKYNKGDKIFISYMPSREVWIESLGNNRFRVIKVQGGKLRVGDEFTALSFVRESLLVLNDLKRGNEILGTYKSSGFIVEIKSIKKEIWNL